ncbi:MAG TPA: sigma-70 family RNA polymerase sigma factor [Chryseosolibacter sp.]|nr:sigma-70 family RNA polymerase sigma factor [Chryseosolibacter sp.]
MEISEDYQTKLFPYAYNILGSIDDARDVIQDVIVNHLESNVDNISNRSAYLIKSVINKSINLKKRSKKIAGHTWLPEPIATENADEKIRSQEIVSYAMLVLLEYLNPKERAVFILKEAFDYSHQEIAEIFSISIETSRQLLSRAKNTLKKQGSDFNVRSASLNDFLSEYVDIIKNGDVKMLEEMLSEHITAQADGGGKGKLLSEFTSGVESVARLIVKGYELYLKNFRIEFDKLNHSPALLFYQGDRLICCQIFDMDTDSAKIKNIYVVADTQKLRNHKKS